MKRSHENRKRLRASTSFPQNTRVGTTTTGSARPKHSDVHTPSLASLQSALEANQKLQQILRQKLLQVHERQYENRQAVSRILEQHVLPQQQTRNPDASTVATLDRTVTSATPKQVQEFFANLHDNENNEKDSNPPVPGRSVVAKFKYQPTRKWTLAYFMDPTGSKPRPNPDTLERQAWRETAFLDCTMTAADEDTSIKGRPGKRGKSKKASKNPVPSFARPESLRLFQLVHERMSSIQQQQQSTNTNEALDWEEIAATLSQDAASKKQRSAWECFCHYRQVLEPQTAPSALVHQPPLDPQQDELLFRYLAMQGPQFVWDTAQAHHVATRLFPNVRIRHLLQRSNQTAALNPNLLAWSSLSGSTNNTADGDNEQDGNEEATSTFWKAKAERKLVLLMKIYQQEGQESPSPENGEDGGEEDDNDDGNGNEPSTQPKPSSSQPARSTRSSSHTSDMPRVAAHFPDRTRQQVSHKWERSLDPQLDHSLFSPQEDALLLETMRHAAAAATSTPSNGAGAASSSSSSSFQGFRNVANQHFPHRKPHQVYARWLEIAPPEDWKTYQSSMILLQRRGISNSNAKRNGDYDSSAGGALLHPNDVRLERY